MMTETNTSSFIMSTRVPPEIDTSYAAVMATLDEYVDAIHAGDTQEEIYALGRLEAMRDRYEWERQQEPNEITGYERAERRAQEMGRL